MSLQVFIQLGTWILRIRQTTKGRTTTIKKKKNPLPLFLLDNDTLLLFSEALGLAQAQAPHTFCIVLLLRFSRRACNSPPLFSLCVRRPGLLACPWVTAVEMGGDLQGKEVRQVKQVRYVEVGAWTFFFLYHKFVLVCCNMYMGYDKHARWDRAYPEVCPCHPISYCSWKKKKEEKKKINSVKASADWQEPHLIC